jgi:hypothetical protein
MDKVRRTLSTDRPEDRRPHHGKIARAIEALADSRTWLHDYVNFPHVARAKGELSLHPDRIDRIAAGILVAARLKRDGGS